MAFAPEKTLKTISGELKSFSRCRSVFHVRAAV
jgi:hypothetical protein